MNAALKRQLLIPLTVVHNAKKPTTMRYLIILILILSSCNIRHDNKAISQTKNQDSLVNELVNTDFLQLLIHLKLIQ